jgi:magnesium chelatase family protein
MPRVPPASLVGSHGGEGSAPVAARIAAAQRLQVEQRGCLNGALTGSRLRGACRLAQPERSRVVSLADGLDLSARGVERLLRAARTIADLDGSEVVQRAHLDEAGRFRALGSRLAGQMAV